jgi:hypothetical protein
MKYQDTIDKTTNPAKLCLYKETVCFKSMFTWFLFVFAVFSGCETAWANLVIHSQTTVEIELTGYNSLVETSIFKGNLEAGGNQEINTPYRGLALLIFAQGQRYPVIIGDESFTLHIAGPGEPPSFAGSSENVFLYKKLSGENPPPGQYDFALLMIQAKDLLESTHSIRTVEELTAKKKEYHDFIRKNYESLKHSDMIRRLIAQYFMMHEYVNYHKQGAPASDIRIQYQKEVVNGVGNWLAILQPHLPEQEILNYCVSLYYDRSMVALAYLIIKNFSDAAYCPGAEKKTFSFPADMHIAEAKGDKERTLGDFRGNIIIAFVSSDCPVSMVETVSKARQLAGRKENMPVIVAPLEKLSDNHLAMRRMLSNGKLFFINDEKWRKENLTKKIKLPLFVRIGGDYDSETR